MRARKRFGQHFLEPAWVVKLVDAVAPQASETFLEIGPGRGALTVPLAARAGRVIAVEIDRDLAAELTQRALPNLTIVTADFLEFDLTAVADAPFRVIGNLPYNVSSPILFKLLKDAQSGARIADATLMLQKEVADRLVAQPRTKAYGVLAVQVALHARVERVLTLPPGAFRPPPKVTSAVVRVRFGPAAADVGDPAAFERMVRGLFLQRRKTVQNALGPVADSFGHSAGDVLARAQVDGGLRPEALTLDDFARLTRAVL